MQMREALQELYGVQGSLIGQYFTYWGRILVLDFGPSLSAFPTPVSDADRARASLDHRPSVHLHRCSPGCSATCSAALAGYYRNSRIAEGARRRGDGLPPHSLLHHRIRSADHVRLPLADPADQRRLRPERPAGLHASNMSPACCSTPSCRRCRSSSSASAAGSSACARWCRTSSPRTTSSMPNSAA